MRKLRVRESGNLSKIRERRNRVVVWADPCQNARLTMFITTVLLLLYNSSSQLLFSTYPVPIIICIIAIILTRHCLNPFYRRKEDIYRERLGSHRAAKWQRQDVSWCRPFSWPELVTLPCGCLTGELQGERFQGTVAACSPPHWWFSRSCEGRCGCPSSMPRWKAYTQFI